MMHVEKIPVELTRELRHKVLWPHIEHTIDCRIAAEESTPGVFHLATFYGAAIVSVGTFFPMHSEKLDQAKQYRLRAMATSTEYEGKGCGKLLLQYAFKELRQQGVEVLWCDARIKAIGFYQNLGFDLIDEVYEVPIIGPHKFMWKLL